MICHSAETLPDVLPESLEKLAALKLTKLPSGLPSYLESFDCGNVTEIDIKLPDTLKSLYGHQVTKISKTNVLTGLHNLDIGILSDNMPSLPESLVALSFLDINNFTGRLPVGLSSLKMWHINVIDFILPPVLTELIIPCVKEIRTVLPDSIKELNIRSMNKLPVLPTGLKKLTCSTHVDFKLIPNTIKVLKFGSVQNLPYIETLPDGLQEIHFTHSSDSISIPKILSDFTMETIQVHKPKEVTKGLYRYVLTRKQSSE